METARHEYFMRQALIEAEQAYQRGEFPVGCVIVSRDVVVSAGRRVNSAGKSNEMDHAEILALRSLLADTDEPDMSGITVYSTLEPCLMCFSTLILNGIRTIVYAYEDAMGGGTNLPLKDLNPFYKDMEVVIIPHILRNESLTLFARFFQNPANRYLQDTYLAEYTLSQSGLLRL